MPKGTEAGFLSAALLALATTSGCITGYVRVHLITTQETNGGAPLYMVVRSIEFKQTAPTSQEPVGLVDLIVRNTQTRQSAGQSYGEIVGLLDAPDGSVMRTQFLQPGHTYRFYLKAPTKGALGLYFLFASPGKLEPAPRSAPAVAAPRHAARQYSESAAGQVKDTCRNL